jgi:VCBS repeat-containing protein
LKGCATPITVKIVPWAKAAHDLLVQLTGMGAENTIANVPDLGIGPNQTRHNFSFTSTGVVATLTFTDISLKGSGTDGFLDNVVVQALGTAVGPIGTMTIGTAFNEDTPSGSLGATFADGPSHKGSLAVSASGQVLYTAAQAGLAAGKTVTDSLTYKVTDGGRVSELKTVTVYITG